MTVIFGCYVTAHDDRFFKKITFRVNLIPLLESDSGVMTGNEGERCRRGPQLLRHDGAP